MERNVLEFIREHKIIAIVRGIPSTQIVQLVQAMVDGVVIYSETKDPTMELTVDIPVKGKTGETKTVTIYFNGNLADTKEVTF